MDWSSLVLSDYKEMIKILDGQSSYRYKPKTFDLATFAPKFSSVIIVDPNLSEPKLVD